MGLTLKHRGGPGFGSGRLRPNEVERYKDTLQEVLDLLKEEVGISSVKADAQDAVVEDDEEEESNDSYFKKDETDAMVNEIVNKVLSSEPKALSKPTPEVVPSTNPTPTTPTPVAPTTPAVSSTPTPDSPFATPLLDGALRASERCIGAYRTNPDEENTLAMRNALLKGASVINAVISQAELAAAKKAKAEEASSSATSTTASAAVEDVKTAPSPSDLALERALASESESDSDQKEETVVEEVPVVVETVETATLGNTETLQKAYDALKATEGDGKFGLKKGISDGELSTVSDLLIDMRKVLMEELDTGIPEAEPQ